MIMVAMHCEVGLISLPVDLNIASIYIYIAVFMYITVFVCVFNMRRVHVCVRMCMYIHICI